MEYGPNPLFVDHFLRTGSKTRALHEVVKNVNYAKLPPQNVFFTEIQKSLLNRHLLWLNHEFDKPETPFWLRKQWTAVSKIFDAFSFAQYEQPEFDINYPQEIYFNENISLETLSKFILNLDQQDWITILDGTIDSFLFRSVPASRAAPSALQLNKSYLNLCNTNRFELFNCIASHCTLNKLAKMEKSSA